MQALSFCQNAEMQKWQYAGILPEKLSNAQMKVF
jgi:hypothetical protein